MDNEGKEQKKVQIISSAYTEEAVIVSALRVKKYSEYR